MRHRFAPAALAALGTLAFAAAGCGGDDKDSSTGGASATTAKTTPSTANVAGNISIVGIWTGDEQKSFQAVIDGFTKTHPKVKVKYNPAGDNVPTVLGTAVEGGNPPDLAAIGQPGVVKQFQEKDALQPLDFARDDIAANYTPDFLKLGTINGKLYSFVFKAANKSTVWYNVESFKNAGVNPPANWGDFLNNAKTLKASGVRAYSIGGGDGWTLTDLFENLYLRQAGPDKYDQLSTHRIKWTDPSVKATLEAMGQVFSDTDNIAGGGSGALETDFPTSVSNVFAPSPKAAQVIEGDFVPGVVASKTKLKPKTGYDVYPFPEIGSSSAAVVGGGDSIAMFKDTPAGEAFVRYLASPEAARIWAQRGGFSSPNKGVPDSAYPDDITRTTATAIAGAKTFRFDMSDLAPAAFGGTPGQGEWKILQDFLDKPSDVDGTASRLEASAAKAFKN